MAKKKFYLNSDKHKVDSFAEKSAYIATDPTMKAAMTTHRFTSNLPEIDSTALTLRVQELIKEVSAGDLSNMEVMLAAQAITLDSIFHRLAGQAQLNIGQYANTVDTYLRLGLKAQAQCRSTIEALAAIKTPKQYINQTNVANLMQVNNSQERLETKNGERMDIRAQAASGRDDQELATLEVFDGSKNA
jgi:hypothetical protein